MVFNPKPWLRFVETKTFTRKWKQLDLSDETLRGLQAAIMLGPQRPPVIEGTGGLRKIRFADGKSSKGKSGSYRTCYVYFSDYGIVFLVTVFGKNEKDHLTKAEKNLAAEMIREIEDQLDQGVIR